MSKIIVVDENDNEIGVKERSEICSDDIYRVSGLWLTNSKGEILLAQRSFNKKTEPGKWGPAVNGTVEEGETYETNIEKEIEEEIGLTGLELQKSPKHFRDKVTRKYFTQLFLGTCDVPAEQMKIQKEEVEQVKWFSKEEIRESFQKNPDEFCSSMRARFKEMGVLDKS
ncbi:MAG: NUDIX domain-containing protein [bacterium]|nr:NUDIX domain-containing protein [bacterium]